MSHGIHIAQWDIVGHLLFFLYRFLLYSFSAFILDSLPQFKTNKLSNQT